MTRSRTKITRHDFSLAIRSFLNCQQRKEECKLLHSCDHAYTGRSNHVNDLAKIKIVIKILTNTEFLHLRNKYEVLKMF